MRPGCARRIDRLPLVVTGQVWQGVDQLRRFHADRHHALHQLDNVLRIVAAAVRIGRDTGAGVGAEVVRVRDARQSFFEVRGEVGS